MTSKFFNFYNSSNDQNLAESLIQEAIFIYGVECYYLPRNLNNFDQLYLTDDQSSYTTAIPVDVYLQSIDGFDGQQNIFSKFGLEIKDSITVSMASRTFKQDVAPTTGKVRPQEGDIIYFKLNKKAFQIKFTNNKEIFYQLGELPTFQLTCNLFEYSGETFNTGIPEIDSIQDDLSYNVLDNAITTDSGPVITTENGQPIVNEVYTQNNVDPTDDNILLNLMANSLIDQSSSNPLGNVTVSSDT